MLADDRTCVQDRTIAHVDRQRALFLDDAAMGHIAAGRELTSQIDDIPHMDIFQILGTDGCRKYLLCH